jgi:hypothetical protein
VYSSRNHLQEIVNLKGHIMERYTCELAYFKQMLDIMKPPVLPMDFEK